jgi:hypothetical protein
MKMPALHTHKDRQIHAIRIEIEKRERWIRDDEGDRRAIEFHKAKIAELVELRNELNQLLESDK